MAVSWTKEQKEAIELHDRDILVSAAAGSGKTAVLVARIMGMITREENPVDIDHLLIVTFTRAAAAEMKERINAALEQELEKDPGNHHLQQQLSFVHNAQISTIDGFCSYVIRNYYHLIDLDPGFRMADEGELRLLKREVVREVLEEAYCKKDEKFLSFVESYSPGRSDASLEDIILTLYETSQSHPWPEEWLRSLAEVYRISSAAEFEKSAWLKLLWEDVYAKLAECCSIVTDNLAVADGVGGPRQYREALLEDQEELQGLMRCHSYQEMYTQLDALSWKRLSGKKEDDVDPEKKAYVQEQRQTVKDIVKKIQNDYFSMPLHVVFETHSRCADLMEAMIELVRMFSEMFSDRKKKKNLLDFSDLEHLALTILTERKNGKSFRTQAAKELAERFEEIFIDEYQDSNYVQEALLTSVSRHEDGKNNIFMVGDVKQSIYRFRLANPKLFMEKYQTFREEGDAHHRIDLDRNFRSRGEVIDFANLLFARTMRESFGGVSYDDKSALVQGAAYPKAAGCEPELYLIDSEDETIREEGVRGLDRELEARMIGKRILQLTEEGKITEGDGFRKIRFSDCVILLRSMGDYGDVISRVLGSMGIPSCVTTRTGYFSAPEVVLMLNVLKICDNPRQDIPLTAVLHSVLFGLTAEDLSKVRISFGEGDMYESCRSYAKRGEDISLRKKLRDFFAVLTELREMTAYTTIHQLILTIYSRTGYEKKAAAMPAGEQRAANLRMLLEKAIAFEKTSYRGLFHFVRYIEQLQKYEVDHGEANINSEQDNTVRIMTIHKSKGLEFPVVFLAGLGKKFNLSDLAAPVIIHPEWGAAIHYIDPDQRQKIPTLYRKTLGSLLRRENLSEELRVLYVAVTRAKEKLILSGTMAEPEKKLEEYQKYDRVNGKNLPEYRMENGRCFLDWILPALAGSKYKPKVVTPAELTEDHVKREVKQLVLREKMQKLPSLEDCDAEVLSLLDERFSFRYPSEKQIPIPVKMTVSELKMQHYEQDEEPPAEKLYEEMQITPFVPAFMQEKKSEVTGAERGTAYHRMFEILDYSQTIENKEQADIFLDQMLQREMISEKMRECILSEDLVRFCNSPIGTRMKNADGKGALFREQPFTMSIPASEKDSAYSDKDEILVQGIIDAFFYDEGEIVLVDYKTDHVRTAAELVQRYITQLNYYARALEHAAGKRVKEKIIYSVALAEEILVV